MINKVCLVTQKSEYIFSLCRQDIFFINYYCGFQFLGIMNYSLKLIPIESTYKNAKEKGTKYL